ncbi:MAG: helix-turn-helix domain-containing protein [Actinomycetota bacterium]
MVTRAEHRRDTLLRLGTAAIDLFEQQGPQVTMAEIADRAGVSRRTVFRYVDGKEELAFVHPLLWFDVFDAALAEERERPLGERLQVASRAIAAHIDADPDPPRRAFLVAGAEPVLLKGFSAVYRKWVERIAAEVLADVPHAEQTEADRFRARIIGSAVMGVVDAVSREWVVSPAATFAELYDSGLTYIAPLLADLPVSRPVRSAGG